MLWLVRRPSLQIPVSASGGGVLCCHRMPAALPGLCITSHVSRVTLRARSPPALTLDNGLSRLCRPADRFALITCHSQTKGGISE